MPSPEDHIANYIDVMPSSTTYLTKDIIMNATSAFMAQDRLVQHITPATEGEEITPLLHQIGFQQQTARRSSMLISCNEPNTSNGRAIDKMEGEIVAFQREYPDVALSYFRTTYKEGTPIGKIRGDLGNAAIQAEVLLSGTVKDIALANCDADTARLSPNHHKKLEQLFELHPGKLMIASPYLRHSRSGGALRNMDRVMGWKDALAYYGTYSSWESHGVMWASTFALAEGHNPDKSLGETHFIIEKLEEMGHHVASTNVRAAATVSPRKMYWNMSAGDERDFCAVESRQELYRFQNPASDISSEAADAFIADIVSEGRVRRQGLITLTAQSLMRYMSTNPKFRQTSAQERATEIQRRLKLLHHLYGGPLNDVELWCAAVESTQ